MEKKTTQNSINVNIMQIKIKLKINSKAFNELIESGIINHFATSCDKNVLWRYGSCFVVYPFTIASQLPSIIFIQVIRLKSRTLNSRDVIKFQNPNLKIQQSFYPHLESGM